MRLRFFAVSSKLVTMFFRLPSDVRSLRLRAISPMSRIQSTGGSPWNTVVSSGFTFPVPSSSSR